MGRDYTKIKAWQLADALALSIYDATRDFPKSEICGLTSQMKRAAISVPANIVEGSARKNKKEYLYFLHVARAFLAELNYYIGFSKQVGYLDDQTFQKLSTQSLEGLKTLQGLISYIETSGV